MNTSSSLTSSRHECWVCDGCEVKQPLYSRFIFEDINDGKIAIMMSLDFSNESVKEEVMCWAIRKKKFVD